MGAIYRWGVALHPAGFRRQFGEEMKLIFEESGRPPRLVLDVFVSLLRQWLLRSKIWIFPLAGIGGLIPFAMGAWFLHVARTWSGAPPHIRHARQAVVRTVSTPVDEGFLMLTATIAVMFMSGTICFAIAWFRYSQRRRQV